MERRECRSTYDQLVLAFEESGAGIPLVFVHGIGADRSRWELAIERLQGRYHCIAVDLPGHGDSPDGGSDVGSAANAVHEVVTALGLTNPVVVGHSLGASVAFVYAAAYEPRSVVAVDPVALDLVDLSQALVPMADRLRGGDWEAALGEWEAQIPAGPLTHEQREWMAAHSRLTRDVLLSYWGALLEPESAAAAQGMFAGVLSAISVPTLVLLGAQPTRGDAAMIKLIESATTEIWDGIGHYPQIAVPDRFADRLASWAG